MNGKVEGLRQVKEIFDKHRIEYWLDHGTLLGAIRHGGFLPWGGDIDLGSWSQNFHKIANTYKELHDKGFIVHFRENSVDIRLRKFPTKSFIDLHLYDSENNEAVKKWFVHLDQYRRCAGKKLIQKNKQRIKIVVGYFIWFLSAPPYAGDSPYHVPYMIHVSLFKTIHALPPKTRKHLSRIIYAIARKFGCRYIKISVPKHFFQNLSIIKFYGMEFKVPSPVEEYLEYRYGKDWRIPKRDWIPYKDDGAITNEK